MKIRKGIISLAMCMLLFGVEVEAKVSYTEPDGKNGYYLSSPEIKIKHSGEEIMRYRLEDANGKVLTGRLDSIMRTVTIQKGILKDGENVLDIWIENDSGNVIESSMERYKFLVDHEPPLFPLTFTKSDVIEILAEDKVSGVEGIYYTVEGQDTQYMKGNNVFFVLSPGFEGKIQAYAVDCAGNKGKVSCFEIKNEKKEEIVIPELEETDRENPSIVLVGIPENGIVSKSINIVCTITDNRQIVELKGNLKQKLVDGTEVISEIEEWKRIENGYQFQRELVEDGIYQIEIVGKDAAGNKTETKSQVIVDQEAPVIEIEGLIEEKIIKEFAWNIQMEDMISDLTSWYSEVRLDGILFKEGQVCRVPGKHILEISARDLAGNETKKTIEFHIEKPLIENTVLEIENEKKEEEFFYVNQEESIEPVIEVLQEEKVANIIPFLVGGVIIATILLVIIVIKKKDPIVAL